MSNQGQSDDGQNERPLPFRNQRERRPCQDNIAGLTQGNLLTWSVNHHNQSKGSNRSLLGYPHDRNQISMHDIVNQEWPNLQFPRGQCSLHHSGTHHSSD